MNNDTLKKMIDGVKAKSFHPGTVVSDEQALGIIVSRYFEWDGTSIMKTAALALEDANFHAESAKIMDMATEPA